MSRKWMTTLWGLFLTVLLIGNSVEASIAPEDRAQLQQSHGAFFYLCKKSVNIDTQAKKEQARQLIITGQDFQMAKALLNKVIELDSKDSEAYLLRALLYTDAKKYIDADNDYLNALRIEPENPTFYYKAPLFNTFYKFNEFYEKKPERAIPSCPGRRTIVNKQRIIKKKSAFFRK